MHWEPHFDVTFSAIVLRACVETSYVLILTVFRACRNLDSCACVTNVKRRWLSSLIWTSGAIELTHQKLRSKAGLGTWPADNSSKSDEFHVFWALIQISHKIILKNFSFILISDATLKTSPQIKTNSRN